MADIRVRSTKKPFYKIDGGVVALLMEMFPEALEKIDAPTFNVQQKANPATPRWAVQKNPWADRMEICVTILNRTVRYPGPDSVKPTVEEAKVALKAATGHEVPAGILQEFAAVLMPGIDPDTIAESYHQAQNKQWAREQAEKLAERKATLRG